MPHKITVKPSGHEFSAEADESILDAALREGRTLPYGCRNGACGVCKGKILEGAVDYGNYQAHALSEAEKAAGLALFCCAKPKTDVVIEVHEVADTQDIKPKTMPCKVEKIEMAAEDVAVLSLKLPAGERLQFLAGQYIDILLKDGKRRAYSLANAPHDDNYLQLHIRRVPGGSFSDHVFTEMHEKAILRFEGPLGSFFLREDSDKPILLLASGTGFAPVKAMLEHAFHHGIKRSVTFYWGAYGLADLYMRELPEKWAREHAHFKFVPVLSEPKAEDRWQGRTGFLHQAVMADFTDLGGYQVYACGSPVMVEAAHHAFTAERGLPSEEFYSDAFTFSKPKA
ncbi:MAG: CDP-6-deoxy-delta-3,4-glucoseen reductase [Betaproteobacteria bacterium]|nr:CDP-6-deoxy-delta-3,4-glucoseen reductase [Betaproteobacteria bacterium]